MVYRNKLMQFEQPAALWVFALMKPATSVFTIFQLRNIASSPAKVTLFLFANKVSKWYESLLLNSYLSFPNNSMVFMLFESTFEMYLYFLSLVFYILSTNIFMPGEELRCSLASLAFITNDLVLGYLKIYFASKYIKYFFPYHHQLIFTITLIFKTFERFLKVFRR